ncbi:MAG: hypothetical protein ACQESP_08590 [Candidatus Muiribacteriota bacterium]
MLYTSDAMLIQVSIQVDELQVEGAKEEMERAFSRYADYISTHTSQDMHARRLYQEYEKLKEEYEDLRHLYQATQYQISRESAVYFFSPQEEANLGSEEEIEALMEKGPCPEADYRLGWLMYIQGRYEFSRKFFVQALKKAEINNTEYPLAYLGLARVFIYYAENQDNNQNYIDEARDNLKKFNSEYEFGEEIEDKKRNFLYSELQERLIILTQASDN